MTLLKQLAAVTAVNLQSLLPRSGASAVVVIGIASVVAVTLCMLAMSSGLSQMNTRTGSADRALVLSTGARSELSSNLSRQALPTIANAPHIKTLNGEPLISGEALVLVDVPASDRSTVSNKLTLRGVATVGLAVRPEIRLTQGRMFQPGLQELIVGQAARQQFGGLEVGSRILFGRSEWTVVGEFHAGGGRQEAELMADVDTVLAAFRQTLLQSVTVSLPGPAAFGAFKAALLNDPTLAVEVMREADYYAAQSQALHRILRAVAYLVGAIMSVGAILGAMNIMYTTISSRTVEIATLRAIGFDPAAIVGSVLAEALVLALVGGVLGATLGWLFFDGTLISTSAASATQVVFPLALTPGLVMQSVAWACLLGLIGGLLPALRAARVAVTDALRAT